MKTIWIVLISVLGTALIAGGGTYYFLNQKAEKDKEDLQVQISDLNKQYDELLQSQRTNTKETDTDATIENNNASSSATGSTTDQAGTRITVRTADLQKLTGEKTTSGSFQTTIYKDFTGDGQEEALVRFTYSGTGSIVDFFVYGVVNNEVKELYNKKNLYKGQVSTVIPHAGETPVVTAHWIDPNSTVNQGKSNADLVGDENTSKQYKWDGSKFIESYLQ